MNFTVLLFLNNSKTKIYADLYNKQHKIKIQDIIIADIDDFNDVDKFYTYCFKILTDEQLLKDVIEEETRTTIIETLKVKQLELQEQDINKLIDNINKEKLSFTISV